MCKYPPKNRRVGKYFCASFSDRKIQRAGPPILSQLRALQVTQLNQPILLDLICVSRSCHPFWFRLSKDFRFWLPFFKSKKVSAIASKINAESNVTYPPSIKEVLTMVLEPL